MFVNVAVAVMVGMAHCSLIANCGPAGLKVNTTSGWGMGTPLDQVTHLSGHDSGTKASRDSQGVGVTCMRSTMRRDERWHDTATWQADESIRMELTPNE
jgi:hypothetical protein